MDTHIDIVEFDASQHSVQVEALWREVFAYDAPRNAPALAIAKKCAVRDGLFFVATCAHAIVGTAMAGYDGHRGWIYSMAVHPDHRHQGIGSRLLSFAEQRLTMLGCVKINLQVMRGNEEAQRFYEASGYAAEDRISMGKELSENIGTPNKAMVDKGMGEEQINSHVFAMLGNVVRNSYERRESSVVSQALLSFLTRACNTWVSIRTLREYSPDQRVFIVDAGTLLRAMYDAYLQAEYLLSDPSKAAERAHDYFDFQHVERYKQAEKLMRHDNEFSRRMKNSPERPEGEKRVNREHDRVKNRFLKSKKGDVRDHWYPSNLRQIASSQGKVEYDIIVTSLQGCVHSSAMTVQNGPPISPEYITAWASSIAARVAKLNVDYNKIEPNDQDSQILAQLSKPPAWLTDSNSPSD
jgi:ribosomal protein S18 acetylase RimI-like enzyme